MKSNLTIALFLITLTPFAQNNQTHFKSEIDFGNGTVFSTFFDVTITQDQFKITSPKNADVRMFGGKAKLARVLGKSPKKGIIITIRDSKKKIVCLGKQKYQCSGN